MQIYTLGGGGNNGPREVLIVCSLFVLPRYTTGDGEMGRSYFLRVHLESPFWEIAQRLAGCLNTSQAVWHPCLHLRSLLCPANTKVLREQMVSEHQVFVVHCLYLRSDQCGTACVAPLGKAQVENQSGYVGEVIWLTNVAVSELPFVHSSAEDTSQQRLISDPRSFEYQQKIHSEIKCWWTRCSLNTGGVLP